jgi:hypothetical protein
MFDGFTQLTILLDNFKEILAGVGKIFSDVFGPALYAVNSFLQIPFVKNTAAWSIAIGSVATAYISVVALLKKINSSIKTQTDLLGKANLFHREEKVLKDIMLVKDGKLYTIQRKLLQNLDKQVKLRAKLAYYTGQTEAAFLELPASLTRGNSLGYHGQFP